jgi:hypothetical protein
MHLPAKLRYRQAHGSIELALRRNRSDGLYRQRRGAQARGAEAERSLPRGARRQHGEPRRLARRAHGVRRHQRRHDARGTAGVRDALPPRRRLQDMAPGRRAHLPRECGGDRLDAARGAAGGREAHRLHELDRGDRTRPRRSTSSTSQTRTFSRSGKASASPCASPRADFRWWL